MAAGIIFDGVDVTRLPPMRRCLAGLGRTFQIPQPFEKLTVFENLLVAARIRLGAAPKREVDRALRRYPRRDRPDRARQRAGRPAHAAGTQAARTGARARHRAEAPAARRDRRRPDRRRMPGSCRDDPGRSTPRGVAIIWIEHVLHALNSVVERLLVLDFGKVIGIGAAGGDHGVARSARDLSRDRGLMALLETRDLTAGYGDFQALFGVDIALERGRDRRHHRRQRRRQDDAAALDRRRARATRRTPSCLDGAAIGALAGAPISSASASPWCRRGASCSPRSASRRTCSSARYGRKAGGPWTLESVYELFPILQRAAQRPGTALSGGQQQMVAIGRALMSNPARAAVRRDQPRPRAGGDPRHLRGLPADQGGRRVAGHRRAGYRPGAEGRRPGLLHDGRPHHAVGHGRPSCRARRSTTPISGRPEHDLARHDRAGRSARRALCPVRRRAQPRLRHHAAGQPRAWRPDRARRLPHPGARDGARPEPVRWPR